MVVPATRTAYAEVNHGRWVVCCPFCPSAVLAFSPEGTPLNSFFCGECLNDGLAAVPILWPNNVDEINRPLEERPRLSNRNWKPSETLADLEDENRRHLGKDRR